MPKSVRSPVDSKLPSTSVVDDPGIPTLATILDPDELAKHLEGPSVSRSSGAAREVRVQVLKWHAAKRCTFEIVLGTGLIGKVYATDRPDVYQVMERLVQAGFGPEAEFSIPQPIAYLPSLRLLLQEKVEGARAKDILLVGDEHQRALVAERCARWLARFHALAPPSGKLIDVEKILGGSERKCRLLCEEGGPLAAKSKQLFERLRAAAPSLSTIPLCASHGHSISTGDFLLGPPLGTMPLSADHGRFGSYQVVLGEGRTVVFDWDVYNTADPARDVAGFILSLERQALRRFGSIRALNGAATLFLETYLNSGGNPQVAAHLPFYKAAHCMRGANWEDRTKSAGWSGRAEAMLEEGLRTLGQ